jgi:cadmium resistance protein CadD (predicted permease)
MDYHFAAIGLAIAAFTATNLDDLLLLSCLFMDAEISASSIIIGQFVGMTVLVLVSVVAALLALAIPDGCLALLGFVPFVLGLFRFWKLSREHIQTKRPILDQEFFRPARLRSQNSPYSVWAIILLKIANGGDNLGVYIPLFATHRALVSVFLLVFTCLTGLWCMLGYYITNHPLVREGVRKYGRIVTPFVLVGIGLKVIGTFNPVFLLIFTCLTGCGVCLATTTQITRYFAKG